MKIDILRKKHPRFVYKKYSYKLAGSNLKAVFDFRLEPDIRFRPEIIIKNIDKVKIDKLGKKAMNNLVFHLGLMEILSYWKAACPKEIIIRAGRLNEEQINWWHDLFIQGLGQFFYENKIDWRSPNFIKIIVNLSLAAPSQEISFLKLKDRYLLPLGGGKDSIVTLEKLKKQKRKTNAFAVNPTKAARNVIRVAGIKNPVIVERKIDPALLSLNKQSYLNGHTPFTAVLSFLSVFCAALFDYQHIAFSNEKSADEGNINYLGLTINHQYSKSSEFERKFKSYCRKYLAKNIRYYSYLRKYSEFEIAKMFSRYPKYFSVFQSCNVGLKTGERWCLKCPKCLFVYLILYPYLNRKQLFKIFGQDLFEDKKLLPVMKDLLGLGRHKPFECVGAYQESRQAFKLSLKKALRSIRNARGKPLPYLLQKINVAE